MTHDRVPHWYKFESISNISYGENKHGDVTNFSMMISLRLYKFPLIRWLYHKGHFQIPEHSPYCLPYGWTTFPLSMWLSFQLAFLSFLPILSPRNFVKTSRAIINSENVGLLDWVWILVKCFSYFSTHYDC